MTSSGNYRLFQIKVYYVRVTISTALNELTSILRQMTCVISGCSYHGRSNTADFDGIPSARKVHLRSVHHIQASIEDAILKLFGEKKLETI